MAVAACGRCSREVRWLEVEGRGLVAFDAIEVMRGDSRFVQEQDGTLTPVRADADVMAMQEHAATCGVARTA